MPAAELLTASFPEEHKTRTVLYTHDTRLGTKTPGFRAYKYFWEYKPNGAKGIRVVFCSSINDARALVAFWNRGSADWNYSTEEMNDSLPPPNRPLLSPLWTGSDNETLKIKGPFRVSVHDPDYPRARIIGDGGQTFIECRCEWPMKIDEFRAKMDAIAFALNSNHFGPGIDVSKVNACVE